MPLRADAIRDSKKGAVRNKKKEDGKSETNRFAANYFACIKRICAKIGGALGAVKRQLKIELPGSKLRDKHIAGEDPFNVPDSALNTHNKGVRYETKDREMGA